MEGLKQATVHDVVFVVEDTNSMGACIEEMYNDYILPALEYFNAGSPRDASWASVSCSTTFSIITFKTPDCLPSSPVNFRGPFTSVHKFIKAFKSIRFGGGAGDFQSSGAEGLALALKVLKDIDTTREKDRQTPKEQTKNIIYVANSVAHDMTVQHVRMFDDFSIDELMKKINEQKIAFSVFAPRKIPFLIRLFQNAGGESKQIAGKNYCKQRTHLILFNGFELPQCPVEPCPTAPAAIQENAPSYPANASPNISAAQPQIVVNQPNNARLQGPGTVGPTQGTVSQPNQGGMVRGPWTQQQAAPNTVAGGTQSDILRRCLNRAQQPNQPMPMQGMANQPQQPSPSFQKQMKPGPGGKGGKGKGQQAKPRQPMPGNQLQDNKQAAAQRLQPGQPQLRPMQPGRGMPTQLPQKSIEIDQQNKLPPGTAASSNPTLKTLLNVPPQGMNPGVTNPTTIQRPMNTMRARIIRNQNPVMGGPNMQPVSSHAVMRQQQPVFQTTAGTMGNQPQMVQKIWEGDLSWTETTRVPNSNIPRKIEHTIRCYVTPKDNSGNHDVRTDAWPKQLKMQLIPKTIVQSIGGSYLQNSRSVLFHPSPCDALNILTRTLSQQFAGCVHFSNSAADLKVLILLYADRRRAYLGFIPNDQAQFVERIRQIIQEQKQGGAANQQQQQQQLQQAQHAQQIQVQQQPTSMNVTAMSSAGTVTMSGGNITMAANTQHMGIVNSRQIPAGSIDPQQMQNIQSLEQELQRRYREAGVTQVGSDQMQMGPGRMMGPGGVIQQGGLRQPSFQILQQQFRPGAQGGMMQQRPQQVQNQPQPQQQQLQQQQQQQQQPDTMLRELLG